MDPPNELFLSFDECLNSSDNYAIIAFSLPKDSDDELVEKINLLIDTLEQYYCYDAYFSFLYKDDNVQNDVDDPTVYVFYNQKLILTFPFIDENQILVLLHNLFSPFLKANTVEELYPLLDRSSFAIITTEKYISSYFKHLKKISPMIGIVDFIVAKKKVIKKFTSESCVLFYRKEDKTINAVKQSSDNDLINLADLVIPIYRNLNIDDILTPETYIISLIADNMSDIEEEFLYKLGEQFPNFIVGNGNLIAPYIEKFIDKNSNNSHRILIFNYLAGTYFNTSVYLKDSAFDPFEWDNILNIMINDINQGKIDPLYLSEDIPEQTNDYLTKIVRKTYDSFINDPTNEVVMLYKRDNCSYCESFFPIFNDFAKECSEAGLHNLKFGYIDIEKNSNYGFPFIPGVPHIQFFPSSNKTDNVPLRIGRDRDSLIRFLQENSKFAIPFEVPERDNDEFLAQILNLVLNAEEYPPEEIQKLQNYLKTTGFDFLLDNAIDHDNEDNYIQDEL